MDPYELIDPEGEDVPANRIYFEVPEDPPRPPPVRVEVVHAFGTGFQAGLGFLLAFVVVGFVVLVLYSLLAPQVQYR